MSKFYADSLGFLALQGKPPVAAPDIKLNLVHLTAAPPPPWAVSMTDTLKWHRQFVETLNSQQIAIVRNRLYLVGGQNGKLKAVLGLQCLPNDAEIELLRHVGIRIVGLAYDKPNDFGGGFRAPDAHLTDDGRKIINACAKSGLILDLSHTGHTTAREILEYTRNRRIEIPLIASHGGCFSTFNHLRNLPDDVLAEIASRDGLVGITNLTFVLDDRINDLEPFFAHVAHAIRICGEDAVCIGTDGIHQELNLAEWETLSKKMIADFDRDGVFGARWPDHPLELNCSNRMEVLTEKLAQVFPMSQVRKLVGANFFRFLEEHL